MAVDTKTVKNRRQVSYRSYNDILADAETLAARDVKTLGNWSYAQILEHLAAGMDASIDGVPFSAPLPMRIIGKYFLKSRFLNKSLPSGYQIPKTAEKEFLPAETATVEGGLAHLRRAIERCQNEPSRCAHPLFGRLSREEWDTFNLRHAELHMSFVRPADD